MNESLLAQLAPSLPWISVQYRQGRIAPAQVKEFGQIAVQVNPDLAELEVPRRGGSVAILKTVVENIFTKGFGLAYAENGSLSVVSSFDFGLDNGEFPLLVDARFVYDLRLNGHRDLSRRLTVAICLLDGFRFDGFLDWWIESAEDMSAGEEDDAKEYYDAKIKALQEIQAAGRVFGCFSRIISKYPKPFLSRYRQEINEWTPEPSTSEEAWKNWIVDVLFWHEGFSGVLFELDTQEDERELQWHLLVGFGWRDNFFYDEYDGMVNSLYEGEGLASPYMMEVTKENVNSCRDELAKYHQAFGGLCQLLCRFDNIITEMKYDARNAI